MIRRDDAVDNPSSFPQRLPAEVLLVGAVLRQALADARRDQNSQCEPWEQQQAIAFLLDDSSIEWWAHLVGADSDVLIRNLRMAAGLET